MIQYVTTMAPIEVIDLTSSPEPDNTPARAAALSRFKSRKEKIGLVHGRQHVHTTQISTIPVNGLPLFYANETQQPEDPSRQGASRANPVSASIPSEEVTTGIWGNVTNGHNLHVISKKPLEAPGLRDIASGAPTINGCTAQPPAGRLSESVEWPARSGASKGGLPQTLGAGEHRATGATRGTSRNGFSLNSSVSAYQHLVDIARPLDGISRECRTRLHEQRGSSGGTPLDYAIRQDTSKTQLLGNDAAATYSSDLHSQAQKSEETNLFPCPLADQSGCSDMFTAAKHARRHARVHTGEKNEICRNCARGFLRRDNMRKHRKRCEASRNSYAPLQSKAAPQIATNLPGSDVEPVRTSTSGNILADGPLNALKRALPQQSSIPESAAKRSKLDLSHGRQKKQPQARVQIIDITDTSMESTVQSDDTACKTPDQTQLDRQTDGIEIARTGLHRLADDLSSGPSRNGLPYSAAEDALLKRLKVEYGLPWPEIASRFSGRTSGSLAVRYHGLKTKESETSKVRHASQEMRSDIPTKRIRKSNMASGMVSWTAIKKARSSDNRLIELDRDKRRNKQAKEQRSAEQKVELVSMQDSSSEDEEAPTSLPKDSAYPSSMCRILRLRELGMNGRRAWSGGPRSVPDELKDHVFSEYGLQRDYQGASGDVIALAWNDFDRFVAGSVAITDQQSMQYNMHRNLLVGNTKQGDIEELLDHHIPRPVIESSTNINAHHAMRESQDPRLFLSVVAAKFCPQDSTRLFTASMDKTLRHYTVEKDQVLHRYAIDHTAPVSVLSVGSHGLVASGCHQSTKSINVFQCDAQRHETRLQLSARQTIVPVYPSALKWGVAYQHRNFLLAGFSGEEDVAHTATGELCLWDASTGQQIHLGGGTRNVFDVAWNPIPSSSSFAFAVAGNANGHVVDKGMRSVIQCFAASQRGGRGVLDWQCPALDINDLVFCPYDDNLIAAGATNGRVYIWDKRSADRSQRPLHTLKHGKSENVLDHDRDAELADTGVQFLSWGSTKNRLYSGSSDGIVKIWNPYRASSNAHIGDISVPDRDRVAIMSGSFGPDFQDLLIGTENGRINHFKSGSDALYRRAPQFKLKSAPEPEKEQEEPFVEARSLLETGQVELRPCGGMPFRQAVQGQNYQGPFLEPSSTQWQKAEQRLVVARLAQAHLGDDNEGTEFAKAAAEVQSAEEGMTDLEHRAHRALMTLPQAEAFQRELALAEKARKELEALVGDVERCKLDCAVLPRQQDDDEVADVSGRSEPRIPGLLRFAADDNLVMEGDVTPSPCQRCILGTRRLPDKVPCIRAACVLKRARMTSACSSCGKPAFPEVEGGTSALCERCAFGCFRCGIPVVVGYDCKMVSCARCGLKWEMGVLGYDLVQTSMSAMGSKMEITKDEDDHDSIFEVGDADREYYLTPEDD